MSLDSTYIQNCLIAGFSNTQIAEACGVTPAAISQHLAAHPEITKIVSERISKQAQRAISIDEKLNSIEEKALQMLERQMALIADPLKLLRIAQVANAAKRRGSVVPQDAPVGSPVTLVLPQHVTANFTFNGNNEAIAIGDRPLVTLPATQMPKLVAQAKEAKDEAHNW